MARDRYSLDVEYATGSYATGSSIRFIIVRTDEFGSTVATVGHSNWVTAHTIKAGIEFARMQRIKSELNQSELVDIATLVAEASDVEDS